MRFNRYLIIFCGLLKLFTGSAVAQNPLGFDMGWTPERTQATLSVLGNAQKLGTWLRVRGMVHSEVWQSDDSVAHPPWPNAKIGISLEERRQALSQLRESGHELVAMVRWPASSWQNGIRPSRAQLPIDLNEVYMRCRALAFTYGDLITAWEIENEPDISFVPENAETFAAFHKACALGILAGREANRQVLTQRRKDAEGAESHTEASSENSDQREDFTLSAAADKNLILENLKLVTSAGAAPAASAVMHSPLALPPGPYWDQLVDNDILAYTEAFNYHYYGFPEDFKGVRDWWIAALEEALQVGRLEGTGGNVGASESGDQNRVPNALPSEAGTLSAQLARSYVHTPLEALQVGRFEGTGGKASSAEGLGDDVSDLRTLSSANSPSAPAGADLDRAMRSLPVFLTEYGYGPLDRFDRFTIEGRERQKRFFEVILPSITDGTIAGAMAFVFMPYYEHGRNEFGLLAEAPEDLRPVLQVQQGEKVPAKPARYESTRDKGATSGDNGTGPNQPSHLFGSADTFALFNDGRQPSPVVIDFIAGKDMQTVKRYNGHLLMRLTAAEGSNSKSQVPGQKQDQIETDASASEPDGTIARSDAAPSDPRNEATSSGEFTLVLYNFSDEPVTGTLSVALDSGTVTAYTPPPPPSTPVEPTSPTDPKTLKPSDPKPNQAPRASPPPPYRRPAFPRSSIRPPAPNDWPTPETPIFTAADGRNYHVSPALQMLMQAAQTSPASVNAAPAPLGTPSSSSASSTDSPSHLNTFSPSHLPTASPFHLKTGFVSNALTLAPNSRHVISLTVMLPIHELKPYQLQAIWRPETQDATEFEAGQQPDKSPTTFAVLETQLYPSPGAFAPRMQSAFAFTAHDNAAARERQRARVLAEGEPALQPNATAERWLSTAGVEIEETLTGWRITINDVPDAPLRPAELELPLPADWTFPADAGLSFKYRIMLPPVGSQLAGAPPSVGRPLADAQNSSTTASTREPDSTFRPSDSGPLDQTSVLDASSPAHPGRFEEIEVALRDVEGTDFGVWPRLFANQNWQSYLEFPRNFTPMFFSRAQSFGPFSERKWGALVIKVHTRTLPTVLEIQAPGFMVPQPR